MTANLKKNDHEMTPSLKKNDYEMTPSLKKSDHEMTPSLKKSNHEMTPSLKKSDHEMLIVLIYHLKRNNSGQYFILSTTYPDGRVHLMTNILRKMIMR
jgi:hypothetical protein